MRRSVWFATVVLAMLPRAAAAQNADPFFFGDDAAIGAGAVVASGRDSGAFWYNPAGLGGLKRGMLSASASTFGLRVRQVPDAMRVRVGGDQRAVPLSSTDVLSVPNAVVAGTAIGERIGIAAGLLTTDRDIRSALVIVPQAPGVDAQGRNIAVGERLDFQLDTAKYHFGAAAGIALTEHLRVGLAAFGTYTKATESVQYAISATEVGAADPERAFTTVNARVTSSSFGATGAAGVQYEPAAGFVLGLSVRAPEVALTSSSEGGAVAATADVGGPTKPDAAYVEQSPDKNGRGDVVQPFRALAGAAIALGAPGSWLEIGADAATGLPESALFPARRVVVNGRAGVRVQLSPEWIVGGGVFSDRALERELSPFVGASRVDYYGLTAGFSKRTPLALVSDPSPEALVLVTTFSLRAAVGFGEARAVLVDLASDQDHDVRSTVVFWELMPYLGSSIFF